jgi:hypothetical protein
LGLGRGLAEVAEDADELSHFWLVPRGGRVLGRLALKLDLAGAPVIDEEDAL